MTRLLAAAYEAELRFASEARGHEGAFHHLTRAHILSQRYTSRHVRVHWQMLKLGVAMRDPREVLGQVTRIVAAAIFSRIWIPKGNTGRANVSALRPRPMPEDLRRLLEASDG